jgi:phosphatidylglycerol---prolipoprotein diacylglyceryl transferase
LSNDIRDEQRSTVSLRIKQQTSVPDLILSRAGMSWFGGFAGDLLTGLWVMRRKKLPKIPVLAAATPALAIGHAIGRIGCLLVGDDYGRPTNITWGIAFPQGLPPTSVPVHPTQIYEAVVLVPIAWLLVHWRKHGRPDTFVLGAYLTLAGATRFFIDFLRVNVRILGPFSVAHLASLVAIAAGAVFLYRSPHVVARTSSTVRLANL